MGNLKKISAEQIKIVNNCVAMAEELVSNFYKMSASQSGSDINLNQYSDEENIILKNVDT